MAGQADGSIIVDTELNSDGFKAGSAELLAAIKALAEEVKTLGATLKELFNQSITPEIDTSNAENKVSALKAHIRELEAELAELQKSSAQTGTATPEMRTGGTAQNSSDLQRQIDAVNTSVERLEPTFQKAMSGSESAMDAFEGKASALECKIAELREKLKAVSQTKFPTQEYEEISAEAEKIGQKLETLLNKQEKMQSLGVSENSAQWKSLQYDLDLTAQKYERLEAIKARMESSGSAFQMGANTPQYAQMESTLSAASARLEEMKDGTSQAENHMNRFASAAGRAASYIGSAAKAAVGTLVSGIKSAASRMAKLLRHSKATNNQFSGLISSAKKFTLSLLGARGVYALLRRAVSAYMAQNQQLANTLSSCWSGIGNILGPVITKLINLVAQAIAYVTSFLRLFGIFSSSATNAINSAGGAASSAAKDLKRQLASFDELNILSDSGSDGGGGGGGESTGAELPDVMLPDWVKLMVEQIKDGDWSMAGETLAGAINSLIDGFDWGDWGERFGSNIQNGISFALGFIRDAHWEGLGSGIATFLNNAIKSISPKDLGALIASKIRIAIEMAYGFVTTFNWEGAGLWVAELINGWFSEIDWKKAAKALSEGLKGAIKSAVAFLKKTDWKQVGEDIGEFIGGIEWGDIFSGLWEAVKSAGGALRDLLNGLHDGLGNILPIVESIGIAFAAWKIGTGILGAVDKTSGLFGKSSSGKGGVGISSPKTVLKGLADMALIIGGLIGIVTVIGEVSKIQGFDDAMNGGLSTIKAAFIGLGEVGLQIIAASVGIIALGKIGVSTIAKGFADFAIVLAGVPVVITAVGALMSISGFTEFLSTGVDSINTNH